MPVSTAASIVPRARAIATVKAASTASWVVKALVDATPISTPARVRYFSSVWRTMALVPTLQIASVWRWNRLMNCVGTARRCA